MPDAALWTLVISLAFLAYAGVLKVADYRRTIQHLKEELSTTRSKEKTLEISDDNDVKKVKVAINYGLKV